MRLALADQRFADNDAVNQAGAMPASLTCTARDALRWATIHGAEACGLESRIGSLRPGKQADIILIGGDSFTSALATRSPAASCSNRPAMTCEPCWSPERP
jgi:imidazolonepropionase-like amidohydrolase